MRFRQYIISKPAKYGIKILALGNSRAFYTWNLEIYAGTQPNGPYELNNFVNEVFKRLSYKLENSGKILQ